MIKLKCDSPGLGLWASVGLRALGVAEGPLSMPCNSATNVLATKWNVKHTSTFVTQSYLVALTMLMRCSTSGVPMCGRAVFCANSA